MSIHNINHWQQIDSHVTWKGKNVEHDNSLKFPLSYIGKSPGGWAKSILACAITSASFLDDKLPLLKTFRASSIAFSMVRNSGTWLRNYSSSPSFRSGFSLGLLLSPSRLNCFSLNTLTILYLDSWIFWVNRENIPSSFCVNSQWKVALSILTIHYES